MWLRIARGEIWDQGAGFKCPLTNTAASVLARSVLKKKTSLCHALCTIQDFQVLGAGWDNRAFGFSCELKNIAVGCGKTEPESEREQKFDVGRQAHRIERHSTGAKVR